MNSHGSPLQARINRTAAKLATLKAQQQAREARQKAKQAGKERATRNRALVLWGVALERAILAKPQRTNPLRSILEEHLTRENERAAALVFLEAISPTVIHEPEETPDEKLHQNLYTRYRGRSATQGAG